MMADQDSKKRLGRGLAALIGEVDSNDPPHSPEALRADRVVAVAALRPNTHNPRRKFDPEGLAELASSVSLHGIVQPILVRPLANHSKGSAEFEIIAGERRWRAAQQAKLHEVPIIIRNAGDREALELAIIENVQRADLNPIEEATGYQQLIEEHHYSQSDLGQTIGKSRSHVANTLRLLRLPEPVRAMIVSGELSAGHARTLVTSADPVALARRIAKEGLSVREAEALQQESAVKNSQRPGGPKREKTPDIRALETLMEERLGLKVAISHKANGRGNVKINYTNIDQLDELCARLGADSWN